MTARHRWLDVTEAVRLKVELLLDEERIWECSLCGLQVLDLGAPPVCILVDVKGEPLMDCEVYSAWRVQTS